MFNQYRQEFVMQNITVGQFVGVPVQKKTVELVERKGIGHPDTLCDAIAEAISRALSKAYLDRFGGILHHNTDAVQISGGRASVEFGGGELIEPMYVLIGGQATKEFDGESIPVDTIALRTARKYLRETIPNLDLESHVAMDTRIDEGTAEFKQTINLHSLSDSNDTSYGAGYAPFSETEKLVYETERALYTELYEELPALGEDMKFMAKREGDRIELTVAAATVSKYVSDMDEYMDIRGRIRSFIEDRTAELTDYPVEVHFNVYDDPETESAFLTETGTVAEAGDDAAVGRGNRVNGLITPGREMSLDAANGKNPANHVGKLYNLLSTELAEQVCEEIDDVSFAQVKLLSQMGTAIDEPHIGAVEIETVDGTDAEAVADEIEAIVSAGLADIPNLIERIIAGDVRTY